MSRTHLVYLGIGSNIDRDANVTACLDMLDDAADLISISSVYESDAVGFKGDPFYNLVVQISTVADLPALGEAIHAIEHLRGRVRSEEKFSPRTLDIDVLLFDELVGTHAGIELPRPELFDQAHVLRPLAEIAPELRIPGTDTTAGSLWDANQGSLNRTWVKPLTWNNRALPWHDPEYTVTRP